MKRGGHDVRLTLHPPLPDLLRLEVGAAADGAWDLDIDDLTINGRWSARRRDRQVDLVMHVTRGWKPTGLPPLMRMMTSVVRIFRTWPTSYRWVAAITLDPQPWMSSRWERTDNQRGSGYR